MKMSMYTPENSNKTMNGFNHLLITLVVAVFATMSSLTTNAQLTGIKNIPGDYATLAAAITDLNTQGVGSGGVTINLIAGNPQTAPAGGYIIGNTGSAVLTTSSAINTILIQGNSNIITAGLQVAGAVNDAVFALAGADYITIQNFVIQENAANTVTAVATNTMTEWGIAQFYESITNGAQNNTIQNNTIGLSAAYQNAVGIYSTSTTSIAASTVSAVATGTTGLNSGFKVYGNIINNVAIGIYDASPNSASVLQTGDDIGGASAATANTITYGNNTLNDAGWGGLFLNSSAGIHVRNILGVNIRFNTVVSSSMTIATTGISTSTAATPIATNAYTNTISNNTVTLTETGAGAVSGIQQGYGNASATHNLNDNMITLNQNLTASSAAQVTGIFASTIFLNVTTNNNTIVISQNASTSPVTSQATGVNVLPLATVTGSSQTVTNNGITIRQSTAGGAFGTAVIYIWANFAPNACSIGTGNISGNQLNTTGGTIRSSAILYGIYHGFTYTNGITINGNTMNIDKTGNCQLIGTFCMTGTSSAVAVTNNNITVAGTATGGQIIVIREQAGSGPSTIKTITGNTININLPGDLTQCLGFLSDFASGSFSNNQLTFNTASTIQVTNFEQTVGSGGGFTIDNNSFSLTSSGLSANITGIIAPAPASGSYTISNNTFNTLSASNTGASSPLVSAITVSGGANNNIFSNTIEGSSTGAGSGSAVFTGIDLIGGAVNNVYRNKIYGLSTMNTGTTTLLTAIRVGGGISTHNIYNNLIGFSGTFGALNSADAIRGIGITSTVDNSAINVANNTIYINAGSTGANFGTTGIFHSASAVATTATLELRNNIVVNLSAAAGTGITAALGRSVAATYANYAATSDRNFYFAGTPGPSNAILNDNGAAISSFTAFQSAIAPAEANSFTGEGFGYATPGAYFVNLTGSDPAFLHLVAGTATKAEGGASPVPAVTDDYDTQVRNTMTPDVGADEFNGTDINTSITNVSVPVAACAVTSHLINADVIVGNGTVASVTLNYNNGAAGSVAMSLGSGNTYTATIPAGTAGVPVTWTITVVAGNGTVTIFNGVRYTDESLSSSQITANSVQTTCAVATGSITVTSPLGAGFSYSIAGPFGPFQSSPFFPTVSPGTYTLFVQNSLNCVVPAPSTITINPQPATAIAPTVTGTINICPFLGTGQVTYTASSPGATSYTWSLPPNVNLISGGSPSNSITVTFNAAFYPQANKQIRVTATAACGTSSQTIYYLLAQSPGTPNPVTGPTNVCSLIGTANTATYTINKSAAATGYVWTIPGLGTTTSVVNPGSGANDTSVIVTFLTGFSGGAITVTATNGCGTSGTRSLTIANAIPSTPGPISGPTNACPYIAPLGTAATYSIIPVSSANTYTWTVLPATAIVSHPNGPGVNDYTITVLYPAGFTGGSITVSATNGCGASANRSLPITRLNPATPGSIDVVQTHACGEMGGRKYTYAIAAVPSNTTTVVWNVPGAATFVNITPIKIEVTYPDAAVTGSVTVQATNGSCVSTIRSVEIKLPACPSSRFTGNNKGNNGSVHTKTETVPVPGEKTMELRIFPNPAVSDCKLEVLTAGSEEIDITVLDNLGRIYKTFQSMPHQIISLGSELKAGSYLIKVRQGTTVKTTRVIKF